MEMDDLSARLAEILNDPESLEKLRKTAETLLSKGDEPTDIPSALPGDDGIDIEKIAALVSMIKSGGDSNRTNLLRALKPHLSEPRKKKVDTAIKLLKIIDILPTLKDSGILDF